MFFQEPIGMVLDIRKLLGVSHMKALMQLLRLTEQIKGFDLNKKMRIKLNTILFLFISILFVGCG